MLYHLFSRNPKFKITNFSKKNFYPSPSTGIGALIWFRMAIVFHAPLEKWTDRAINLVQIGVRVREEKIQHGFHHIAQFGSRGEILPQETIFLILQFVKLVVVGAPAVVQDMTPHGTPLDQRSIAALHSAEKLGYCTSHLHPYRVTQSFLPKAREWVAILLLLLCTKRNYHRKQVS